MSFLKDIRLYLCQLREDRRHAQKVLGPKGGFHDTDGRRIFSAKLKNEYDHRNAEAGLNSMGDTLRHDDRNWRKHLSTYTRRDTSHYPVKTTEAEEIIEGVTYSSIEEFKRKTEARKKGLGD